MLPVKKLNVLAAAFISTLLLSTYVGTKLILSTTANPINSPGIYCKISIQSPANKTYNVNAITLNFTVLTNQYNKGFFYFLDEQATVEVEQIQFVGEETISDHDSWPAYAGYAFQGEAVLSNLPDGSHNLTVFSGLAWGGPKFGNRFGPFYAAVNFSVDATFPTVSILSPENKTYNATEIELRFTVSEPASWMGYSLDGQENITISGNTTLTGLTDEPHNITVYAKDAAGNIGTSETVTFTVDTPEPFPTAQVATVASGASVAGIGVGLFVYFRKRNH